MKSDFRKPSMRALRLLSIETLVEMRRDIELALLERRERIERDLIRIDSQMATRSAGSADQIPRPRLLH